MEWITDSNILIVGLGLIGGSYARALHRLGFHVSAVDARPEALDFALEAGFIDRGYVDPEPEALAKADTVIFALYPGAFRDWLEKHQRHLRPGAMLTDVTGVKGCLVYDIQAMLRPDLEFIAAHPMAGRERSGVEYSDDRIFRDANYIVVPTEKNSPEAVEWCKGLGRILGFSHIAVLTPEEHDEMIGFVSQLTHVIAVALMTCSDNSHLAEYTGDSFRDLTRIARINEVMWSELFLRNREALLRQMDSFMDEMAVLRQMLERGDAGGLMEKMRLSTARRALFDKIER